MNRFKMNIAHWSRLRLAASALLGVVILGACEGENLFDPNQNPFNEIHAKLSGSGVGVAGDTLRFQVSGDAPNNLSRFDVTVRGAVVKDTSLLASGRQNTATVRVALPSELLDTLLFVSVRAVDAVGNRSAPDTATFIVAAKPFIASLTGGEALAPGSTATLRVRATGLRALAELRVVTSGAVQQSSNHTFPLTSGTDITRDVPITIPTNPSDTIVRVDATVTDVSGLKSLRTFLLPIQQTGPAMTGLEAPGAVDGGSDFEVQVTASAMRGVKMIKLELRGASGFSRDTTIAIAPPQIAISKYVTVRGPGNVSGQVLTIRAYAIDTADKISAPLSALVFINSARPVLSSVNVLRSSVPAGGMIDVTVDAAGSRALTAVTLLVRYDAFGGSDKTVEFKITPPTTFLPRHVVAVAAASPPCGQTVTATVYAFVTDEAGEVSPIVQAGAVSVVGPICTAPPDTTGGTI